MVRNKIKIFGLITLLTLLGCSGLKNKTENVRIPKTAFWAENKGNGNWFDIEWINNHRNMTRISIYDKSGELVLKSRFMKVCPVNELKFIEDIKKEIDFYDGEKIQLKGNCYLQTN